MSTGLIVAHHTIDYSIPVQFDDKLEVEVSCTRTGSKSFDHTYELYIVKDGDRALAAKGVTTLVCYNHITKDTMEIPEEWRKWLRPD